MTSYHNPETIAAPTGLFSHGVECAAGARWLHVSGQIGNAADGAIGKGIDAQSTLTWFNIIEVLKAAAMGPEDIVKMTTYLLDSEDLAAYGAARAKVLGDHQPASTLVFVAQLILPELLVEVDVIAAKSG